MNTDITVALIALGAALLSGLLSWAVGRHHTKAELEKIRMELRHVYATGLQAKRIEVYPKLYQLLSDFVKKINFREADRDALKEFSLRIDEWDSAHSVFLGIYATQMLYEFRKYLRDRLRSTEGEGMSSPEEAGRELIGQIEKVEIAVKADLGVFSLAFYDPEREWTRYSEVEDALRNRARSIK